MISGNLNGPQRVIPDNSSNRLDIEFFTESHVKNISIGSVIKQLYLSNTIADVREAFLNLRPASTKPSRRKTVEVLSNCSLTLESNFESIRCFKNYIQTLPWTKNPENAYLGAVGFSEASLVKGASQVLELVGDKAVNIILINSKGNNTEKKRMGIQVPEWDKKYPNSSFIGDYSPSKFAGGLVPYYITCNLTKIAKTRNCTNYEIRAKVIHNSSSYHLKNYHLRLLEKFDLNQIPEFADQHVLKIGAVRIFPNIYYITREFKGQRKDIKLLMRYNYTKKITTFGQSSPRIARLINQMELPFNLTNDMNFDVCFGGSVLMAFLSPSEQSEKKFPPKIYAYFQMYSVTIGFFIPLKRHWDELDMGIFDFLTIRRLQCFDNYFAVIGDDRTSSKKSRITIFSYNTIRQRYNQTQIVLEPEFPNLLDPLNIRRYDQVLDKARPGLEYQVKFIRLTQKNQIVFDNATILVFKSVYKPWYRDDNLLRGAPPDTKAEGRLAKNYTDEINFDANALFHESIYYMKGVNFKGKPVDINQTVVSTFGPPDQILRNQAPFRFTVSHGDKIQVFKSKLSNKTDKLKLQEKEYMMNDLVQVVGTIVSTQLCYRGGEVYNVTSSENWPQLTDKLYMQKKGHPNRDRMIRRFSTIVDFSAKLSNTSSTPNCTIKQFISNIYLNNNPVSVEAIKSQEE